MLLTALLQYGRVYCVIAAGCVFLQRPEIKYWYKPDFFLSQRRVTRSLILNTGLKSLIERSLPCGVFGVKKFDHSPLHLSTEQREGLTWFPPRLLVTYAFFML